MLARNFSDDCVLTDAGIVPPPAAVTTVVPAAPRTRTSAAVPEAATKFAAPRPRVVAVGLVAGLLAADVVVLK